MKKRDISKEAGKLFGKKIKSGKKGNVKKKDSNTNARTVRKVKSKKRLAALHKHAGRNVLLNGLAGEVNNIICGYAPKFKRTIYRAVLSRFRKEPENNRLLLLHRLKGMEINPDYQLSKLAYSDTSIHSSEDTITINLDTITHPLPGRHKADCYFYEVILLCWSKRAKKARFNNKFSQWIPITGKLPVIDFVFPKPADANHWLLCLRLKLGVKKSDIDLLASQGMQIVDVGSFDKKEQELLDKQQINQFASVEKPKGEEVERVQAKAWK